jgi:hypothetical protein
MFVVARRLVEGSGWCGGGLDVASLDSTPPAVAFGTDAAVNSPRCVQATWRTAVPPRPARSTPARRPGRAAATPSGSGRPSAHGPAAQGRGSPRRRLGSSELQVSIQQRSPSRTPPASLMLDERSGTDRRRACAGLHLSARATDPTGRRNIHEDHPQIRQIGAAAAQ